MGLALSSPTPSSSSLPPTTIVVTYDDTNNGSTNMNMGKDGGDDVDLEEAQPTRLLLAERIRTLTTLRDKGYQKLGNQAIRGEEKALLQSKIQKYDSKLDALRDQDDRLYKDSTMYRDALHQIQVSLNSTMTMFAIVQGLLIVAASPLLLLAASNTNSNACLTGHGQSDGGPRCQAYQYDYYCYLLVLTLLGMVLSVVILIKIRDEHSLMDHVKQSVRENYRRNACSETNAASDLLLLLTTSVPFTTMTHTSNCSMTRKRLDLVVPVIFLIGWLWCLVVLIIVASEFVNSKNS
jgi:hypothetical protein